MKSFLLLFVTVLCVYIQHTPEGTFFPPFGGATRDGGLCQTLLKERLTRLSVRVETPQGPGKSLLQSAILEDDQFLMLSRKWTSVFL